MAIRVIREIGDDILEKQCKAVPKMTLRTKILIGDMLETMYESNGVGLAAPQVGVLKRIVVIDVGEGPIVLINPQIIESSGEQTGEEGCLSVPGKFGIVTRPDRVKVRAFDENMNEFEMEGEGLLARAFCHELDHLDGKLYVELAEDGLHEVSYDEEDQDDAQGGEEWEHPIFRSEHWKRLWKRGMMCVSPSHSLISQKAEEKKCSLRL